MVLIPLLTLNLLFTHGGRHVQVRKLVAHCCSCVLVAFVELDRTAVLVRRGEPLLRAIQFVLGMTSALVRKDLPLLSQGAVFSQRDTSFNLGLGGSVARSRAW